MLGFLRQPNLRLLMRSRSHVALIDQRRQKGPNRAAPQIPRMLKPVKANEAPNPMDIRLLSSYAVVLETDALTNRFKQDHWPTVMCWRHTQSPRASVAAHKCSTYTSALLLASI